MTRFLRRVNLKNNYECNINIKLDSGDIQFDVSNDEYVFSFKSGLTSMAITHAIRQCKLSANR